MVSQKSKCNVDELHNETILLSYLRNITGRNEFLRRALIEGHSLSYKHNMRNNDDEEVFWYGYTIVHVI